MICIHDKDERRVIFRLHCPILTLLGKQYDSVRLALLVFEHRAFLRTDTYYKVNEEPKLAFENGVCLQQMNAEIAEGIKAKLEEFAEQASAECVMNTGK
jgi:hypothetical protein